MPTRRLKAEDSNLHVHCHENLRYQAVLTLLMSSGVFMYHLLQQRVLLFTVILSVNIDYFPQQQKLTPLMLKYCVLLTLSIV
jgi:hypothetical protein